MMRPSRDTLKPIPFKFGTRPQATWHCPRCGTETPTTESGTRCPRGCPEVYVDPAVTQRHPDDVGLGRLIGGRYALVDIISRRSVGTLYRAQRLPGGQQVSVRLLGNPGDHFPRDIRATFLEEAARVARITHPGLVPVLDYGETSDGLLYLVQGEAPGTPLSERLADGAHLEVDEAIRIAQGLLMGLAAAHKGGALHRDIKPSHVLVTSDGHVRLQQLGIGALMDAWGGPDGLARGVVLGTPLYMAPELVTSGRPGPATDLYAVGCLLFRMLSGRPPFTAADGGQILARHVQAPVPALPRMLKVPAAVGAVVRRALAKMPQDRFTSAMAMARALEDARAALVTTWATEPRPAVPMGLSQAPLTAPDADEATVVSAGPAHLVPDLKGPAFDDEGEEATVVGEACDIAALFEGADSELYGVLTGGSEPLPAGRVEPLPPPLPLDALPTNARRDARATPDRAVPLDMGIDPRYAQAAQAPDRAALLGSVDRSAEPRQPQSRQQPASPQPAQRGQMDARSLEEGLVDAFQPLRWPDAPDLQARARFHWMVPGLMAVALVLLGALLANAFRSPGAEVVLPQATPVSAPSVPSPSEELPRPATEPAGAVEDPATLAASGNRMS